MKPVKTGFQIDSYENQIKLVLGVTVLWKHKIMHYSMKKCFLNMNNKQLWDLLICIRYF